MVKRKRQRKSRYKRRKGKPGWYGDSGRHRIAALKAWENRKKKKRPPKQGRHRTTPSSKRSRSSRYPKKASGEEVMLTTAMSIAGSLAPPPYSDAIKLIGLSWEFIKLSNAASEF